MYVCLYTVDKFYFRYDSYLYCLVRCQYAIPNKSALAGRCVGSAANGGVSGPTKH